VQIHLTFGKSRPSLLLPVARVVCSVSLEHWALAIAFAWISIGYESAPFCLCRSFLCPVAHPCLSSLSLSLFPQGRDAMNWAIEQLPADFKDRVPSPSLSRKSMHAS
jgi:hypothetical protein